MIVVTGAAGFIGSCMIAKLLECGYGDIVAVDEFSREDKMRNIADKELSAKVPRKAFHQWLKENHKLVQVIIHMGARTDTTEFDYSIFQKLNIDYSKTLWQQCVQYGLPFIYASSAATYGDGSLGYSDAHEGVEKFKPLNPYGESKQTFDLWALSQKESPYYWIGLKFFNVYGPNEYHKGRMASVVLHAHKQIQETGKLKLFRSHRDDYDNGEQKRDFVYVKDVVDVMLHLLENRDDAYNGIYNMGTGKARTFNDLASSVFRAMRQPLEIDYIDTPEDIRDKYQYFTEANMEKLRKAGYQKSFTSLEDGVAEYVSQYLNSGSYY